MFDKNLYISIDQIEFDPSHSLPEESIVGLFTIQMKARVKNLNRIFYNLISLVYHPASDWKLRIHSISRGKIFTRHLSQHDESMLLCGGEIKLLIE